ncbi:Alkaline shock response membrane anchor protein AmaP OS=Tsukamurella paurometabola (strain ATCC 8368/ DSM / CCUG 35730 / CIP 100753 / JCM 10117 / KCTC 9821 / NBRC 16120 / NCIMB 702349 / NCTC 13040) OX=521096 GN=Tpau_4069 PE=4 SV=1 [Tsukamurella paurometabola]|uniref:Alkaline shock response membrane anchor protein AmaP n=1 Tax=Tsukamurella paurometabola (strain ATCC 8368 / DSM 20162 / CCUG 35730 / CIP 100753 / JCM 10117 / KCTC 9821 / NBRC 16120 / NCIMB 702349 / NCTC 13040) TaxID=521096 RepID=D5UNE4_TSUPD|nr:hypothetical protein [Tsukamurella paurometabola]ADG80639.1 conserved hypothetical protein [Tsukamurella paurometabola DSM 20162]SUP40387.1 Uncharacterised protein [Tsukamurella paurometabola]
MRSSTRVIDRILTGLLGLGLIAGGGWLLAYRQGVRFTTDATHRLAPDVIARTPDQPWWQAAVVAAGVVLILLTAWLLVRHLRAPASKTVDTEHGGTVDLSRIADAVADDLARSDVIRRARARTLVERGHPVIRVSATVAPGAADDELATLARAAQHEVTRATNPDVRLQLLVNGEDASERRRERSAATTEA